MPIKDKSKYNEYMKKYMRRYKEEIEARKQKELESMLDVQTYPINQDFPNECLLFRTVELGLKSREEFPFVKINHLNKSTHGRENCRTCKPFCRCFEWHQNRKPIKGVRIW